MWNEVVAVVLKVGDPKKECKNNISQNYIPRLATYFCPSGYSAPQSSRYSKKAFKGGKANTFFIQDF